MKKFIILLAATVLLASCSTMRRHDRSLSRAIAGHYTYTHSWDYASPDGAGKMHCDETGTLVFNPDGTYTDIATQKHYHILPDSSRQHYPMNYYCEGRWKVQDGKFLFCEHAENFKLEPADKSSEKKRTEFAELIYKQTLPDSQRWFTFDIERLDSEWFIWSYTDKRGNKTTWEMERDHQ